jgi:hypothetical protein
VSANRVIPDPVIETNCPSHTIEKPNIPDGRRLNCFITGTQYTLSTDITASI